MLPVYGYNLLHARLSFQARNQSGANVACGPGNGDSQTRLLFLDLVHKVEARSPRPATTNPMPIL